jgi:hypothetical protein
VADPALVRAMRQRAQAEALAAHDTLRSALVTDGSVRLSQFGELPLDAFAELLGLLAVGLDAPIAADGTRRALSADGCVEVVMHDPRDGRTAAITTQTGTLRGPDLIVAINVVDAAEQRREASGG